MAAYVGGPRAYFSIISEAYPKVRWFGPFDSPDTRFEFAVISERLDDPMRFRRDGRFEDFRAFLGKSLLVVGALDECWALGWHRNGGQRSALGQLVYEAKTYDGKYGDPRVAERLARFMGEVAEKHPRLRSIDRVVGVPANPPKFPHNLPEVLARGVGTALGLRADRHLVRKLRRTRQMKNCPSGEKRRNLLGAYEVTKDVRGQNILIVDDLVRSGTTLEVIADVLRDAGARGVIGLAATKTLRD